MSELFEILKSLTETPTQVLIAFALAVLLALQLSDPKKDSFRFGAYLILAYVSAAYVLKEVPQLWQKLSLALVCVIAVWILKKAPTWWEDKQKKQAYLAKMQDPLSGLEDFIICVVFIFLENQQNQFLARMPNLEELELDELVREVHLESVQLQSGERIPFSTMPHDVRLYEFLPRIWQHLQTHRQEIQRRRDKVFSELPPVERIKVQDVLNQMPQLLSKKEDDFPIY